MSKIVEFRDRIIEEIRAKFPDLHVDWYDGLFDEEDVREWGGSAPAAYVAVLNVPTAPHTTGEMLADLRVVVVVVTQDADQPRDADASNWTYIEKIAVLAKDNKFGDPNASVSEGIEFKRMRHPELRREAVAIGIVEWRSNLTIGENKSRMRDEILGLNMPSILTGRSMLARQPGDLHNFEDER